MERVVYILGAGFSAPLGLPVVSNFLNRAKDLYADHPTELAYFGPVLEQIAQLARIKNYFASDLFDIEEILSIFEMQEAFEGRTLAHQPRGFVTDVVSWSTPKLPLEKLENGWRDSLVSSQTWRAHAAFVASLFQLTFVEEPSIEFSGPVVVQRTVPTAPSCRYDVISLNYDMVLENASDGISKRYQGTDHLRFTQSKAAEAANPSAPWLAKLHGSVHDGNIVPPTWRKAVSPHILEHWAAARDLLGSATQIRIVGYSLPISDSYIKYLLKAGAAAAPRLKHIDVICLDPTDEVQRRYEEFITFKFLRFRSANVHDLLQALASVRVTSDAVPVKFDHLESLHDRFMRLGAI